jgi:sulfur carrier protein ThiS
MKVHVRLYGTLGNDIPDHDPLNGMVLEIPEGSNTGDLMDRLAIPRKKVGIISVDGSLAKASKQLYHNNVVRIYRPIAGG